jgi:hypothetical protein
MTALRRMALLLTLLGALGTVAALAAAPSVLASAAYGCYLVACPHESGPNEFPIDSAYAENRSGTGICSRVWKYHGGSYTVVAEECKGSPTVSLTAVSACEYDAHGEVARYYAKYEYKMAGEQYTNYSEHCRES